MKNVEKEYQRALHMIEMLELISRKKLKLARE